MKADPRFIKKPKSFWACVRSLSQELGYTVWGEQRIKVYTFTDMERAFVKLNLNGEAIIDKRRHQTALAVELHDYFTYRAEVLDKIVSKKLMSLEKARGLFEQQSKKLGPKRLSPMNKQSGDKKAPAYFTGLINMLVEHHSRGADCDFDPRKLTTITRAGVPLRTLARRVDGAFPNSINPVAIWEIKEYYYTTTFGSRVADGVYESLLDGLELEELRLSEGVDVKHYLMIDDYNTWWNMGRSYLCRIVDMLNMGYVDEAIFGEEVMEAIPRLVDEWIALASRRAERGHADPPAQM